MTRSLQAKVQSLKPKAAATWLLAFNFSLFTKAIVRSDV